MPKTIETMQCSSTAANKANERLEELINRNFRKANKPFYPTASMETALLKI